jgi:hypothetical protein
MFFHPNELTNDVLYINPDFKDLHTKVNHNADLTFEISSIDNENYLFITIDIVFSSSIDKTTTVAQTVFSKDNQFDVSENKAHDEVALQNFLSDMSVEIEKYLGLALPTYMIKVSRNLITETELYNLKNEIMYDLVKRKFY